MAANVAIHISASPTDIFFSQLSFFRLALLKLGYDRDTMRIRAFLGDVCERPIPARWYPYLKDVEFNWASPDSFREKGFYAQCDASFLEMDPDAEITLFCDSDTFWVRRPDAVLSSVAAEGSVAGVIAHGAPPAPKGPKGPGWARIFEEFHLEAPQLPYKYGLWIDESAPFYVNFGFVPAATRALFPVRERLVDICRQLRDSGLVAPYFSYQIGLTVLMSETSIPSLKLPLIYNFPNHDRIFNLHRIDPRDIHVVHYFETTAHLDRKTLFVERDAFSDFVTADLEGADDIVRDRIVALTEGEYPFASEKAFA